MKPIDIIFVNCNSTDHLIKCLETVYASIEDLTLEILVIDNGSSDGVDRISSEFSEVCLKKNSINIGFSPAVNQGLLQTSSPYIMLLNPDARVEKGFFKTVLEYMEEKKDVGILGPKVLNDDGSVQGSARVFPTPLNGLFGRTSILSKLFPNNRFTRQNILTKSIDWGTPAEVDWVSGACMVIRRKAIEDVGPMDDSYFMYFEDVDWCRRMWQKGWKVVYYPLVSIVHYVGGSSDRLPIRSVYEFHKSCYRFFVMNSKWPKILMRPFTAACLSARFLMIALLRCFRTVPKLPKSNKPRILFFITEDWYFWSHRLPLARAARDSGFEVLIATRVNEYEERIINEGFRLIPLQMDRRGRNPLKEISSFVEIVRIYRREKPDIVHHVTMKPILYGSWAGMITCMPAVVNAIAGLGFIFVAKGWKLSIMRRIALMAYRTAFYPKRTVGIFQNPENIKFLEDFNVIKEEKSVLIPGSGVDIKRFVYVPETDSVPTIVFAARLIWEKGAGVFADAARILQDKGFDFKFIIVGKPDFQNPSSIPEKTINQWHNEGVIEWKGHIEDMPELLSEAHLVVLPTTYGEGIPKILIEAAACGRAIVATDIPGCREIVRDGENGILVPPHSPEAVAEAVKKLIDDPLLRKHMGKKGREMIETEFSEEIIVAQTMMVYENLLVKKTKTNGE